MMLKNRTTANLAFAVLLMVSVLAIDPVAFARSVHGGDTGRSVKSSRLPENPNPDQVDALVAQLNDAQVRRLLIDELRKSAQMRADAAEDVQDSGRLSRFIIGIGGRVEAVRHRIAHLKSGAAVVLDVPESLKGLADGTRVASWPRFCILMAAIVAVGFAVRRIWSGCVRGLRKRIAATAPDAAGAIKVWHLLLRGFLDAVSIVLEIGAILAMYIVFAADSGSGRLFLLAYLIAVAMVGGIRMISRLALAPGASGLRFLPIEDTTAVYLHRRILWITLAGAFGWLTCGLFSLQGISEMLYLGMVVLTGLVIAGILIGMIHRNRDAVARILGKDLPPESPQIQWADNWHRIAVAYLLVLWSVWVVSLVLVGAQAVIPVIAVVLSFPAFFILDRMLQGFLNLAFTTGSSSGPADRPLQPEPETLASISPATTDLEPTPDSDRFQRVTRRILRVIVVALIGFWLLDLWGIALPVGKALAHTAFSIVGTVLLAYVAWELVRVPIERRLRKEMPKEDEEMEEGGSGGSRIGTLLLLLKKFILSVLVVLVALIILSAMGIDIGPLIAGAGVVGLAIGFGAQTLVKDIISGVFFLVDDAFRVGDYIDTGAVKGMVEKISLRSMQLRHPRGMVHTIPFGDIGSVTNFSRDYIITKLDFRVRYDTDVEKVRKLIKKKVYLEILKDEKLAPKLLGKIKSQGVREMDDSAMIMRVKFKTPPGEQFVLRREVFRRMQEAFRKAGIEFAHRNVTVYLPSETGQSRPDADTLKRAGAAAASAGQSPVP